MIEFTSTGYIEVRQGSAVLSRHRVEREAIESCAKNGTGSYELHYPVVRVTVSDTGTVSGVINGTLNA